MDPIHHWLQSLDLATASLITGIAGMVVSAIFAAIRAMNRAAPAIGSWQLALGMACYGSAFLIIAAHDMLPHWTSPVVANGLLVLAFVLFALVMRKLLFLPTRATLTFGAGLVLACIVENAWFLAHDPHVNTRLVLGSFCQLAATGCIVAIPWQVSHDKRTPGLWLVSGAFALFGMSVVQRIYFLVSHEALTTIFAQGSLQSLSYLAAAMLPLAASIGFLQLHSQLSQERYRRLADSDPLTGCLNRRAIEQRLAAMLAKHRPTGGSPLSIALIDLDDLKRINDAGGHAAGDEALVELAVHFRRILRRDDTFGRMGGDEFIVLMDGTGRDGAGALVQRLRESLAGVPVPDGGRLSFSSGVAQFRPGDDDIGSLLLRADHALYADKRMRRTGRTPATGNEPGSPAED